MSEGLQPVPPKKTPETAAYVVDRLYCGQYEEVLTPAAHQELHQTLGEFLALADDKQQLEFLIQFYIAETEKEVAERDELAWIGIIGLLTQDEGDVCIIAETLVIPTTLSDPLFDEELSRLPTVTLQWQDIAWGSFDHTQGAH